MTQIEKESANIFQSVITDIKKTVLKKNDLT